MATLNRIVVYTDLSPASTAAVRVARAVAAASHAGLDALRVVDEPLSSDWTSELATEGMPAVQDAMETELRESLAAALGEREAAGVDLHIEAGDPADEIVRYAAEQHPDLIVFGLDRGEAHGDQAEIAQAVVVRAHCSVLVVRQPA